MEYVQTLYWTGIAVIQWSKQMLPSAYHIHIWQDSLQLNCEETWQKWTLFDVYHLYKCKIKVFYSGEINERGFSNPTLSVMKIGL